MIIKKKLKNVEYKVYNRTTVCKLEVDFEQKEIGYTALGNITAYGSAKCGENDTWDKSFGELLSLCRAKINVGRKIEKLLLEYSQRFSRNPIEYTTYSEWGFKPRSAMTDDELEQTKREYEKIERGENIKANIVNIIPKYIKKISGMGKTAKEAIELVNICTDMAIEAGSDNE